MLKSLQEYIEILRREKEIVEIRATVDPHLEAAEIHRRVIAEEGPALLFANIKNASFPLVTNLFGSKKRIELAFGRDPTAIIGDFVSLIHDCMPPSIEKLWSHRKTLLKLPKMRMKKSVSGPVLEVEEDIPHLNRLPLLTTWKEDGGAFFTLPLVYTEDPETRISNMGIYRLQRYDDESTGFHCQIGKGGGFHLAEAARLGRKLPVSVWIGGPPALVLAAASPLPENIPEILLASLIAGEKISAVRTPYSPHPVLSEAEFVLLGEVDPNEIRPEGAFGDHYGYYSLQHDYPVFRCTKMLRRKNPVCTATVVGKGRQEDCFLGDYIQKLFAPIFPLIMPSVCDFHAYGEAGYHSVAAAVVKQQRYKREALTGALRLLGEGQLSLTKFLFVCEERIDLQDFRGLLEHVLERSDFRSDLYVLANTSLDTLDYTSTKVNEGSRAILLGIGEPKRILPGEFHGTVPRYLRHVQPFCRGCLVVEGAGHQEDSELASRVASEDVFREWPFIILSDKARKCVGSVADFLWYTFTRFEPARDIHSLGKRIEQNHIVFSTPLVVDARMKAGYPDELECDPETAAIVNRRWREYFTD